MSKKNKSNFNTTKNNNITINDIIDETEIIPTNDINENIIDEVLIPIDDIIASTSETPLLYGEFKVEENIIPNDTITEVKQKRSVSSLNSDEYRTYLKTGIIPD